MSRREKERLARGAARDREEATQSDLDAIVDDSGKEDSSSGDEEDDEEEDIEDNSDEYSEDPEESEVAPERGFNDGGPRRSTRERRPPRPPPASVSRHPSRAPSSATHPPPPGLSSLPMYDTIGAFMQPPHNNPPSRGRSWGKRTTTTRPLTNIAPTYADPKQPPDGPRRAQRLQRSYIVRDVPSFIPTEIYRAAGAFEMPNPPPDTKEEPLRTYLNLLKNYAGFDPAALNFPRVEDRVLMSSKARDESESEHYQRILATLKTADSMKMTRVKALSELIESARRDISDANQHDRFVRVIDIKEKKGDSDAAESAQRLTKEVFEQRVREGDHADLGWLKNCLEVVKMREEIANLETYRDNDLYGPLPDTPSKQASRERIKYLTVSMGRGRTA